MTLIDMLAESNTPHSGQITITPDQARKILAERNTSNRKISSAVVSRYARDMRGGDWVVNGDAIRFASDGTLLDGQHRLAAIVLAKVAVRTFVVWGLPTEAQSTMDDGRKRTMANVLELDGKRQHAKTVASILRRVILLEKGASDSSSASGGGGSLAPTKAEMSAYYAEHPEVLKAATVADHIRGTKTVRCAASTLGLAYLLCAAQSEGDADEFFNRLRTGAGLEEGSPILVLRNKLSAEGSTRLKTETDEALAWFIRAWNAYRQNRSIKILRYKRGDEFPKAV